MENLVPVFGFEDFYEVDKNGVVFSNKTKAPLQPKKHASLRADRVRLCDRKYYDVKYLVLKSFNREDSSIMVNDDRIIFVDGNCRNNRLSNLKMLNTDSREEICLAIKARYGKEEVKPIPEYRNYYLSNDGDIFSYYRSSAKQLKPYVGTDGYLHAKIPDNWGADTHIRIHKAVATLFVTNPNPCSFSIVHHKDENKMNNYFKNLEWTTLQQNTIYSIGKKCCMVDTENCILSIHDTVSDLARYYRVDSSCASKQCNGKKNCFHGGMKARFFDEKQHSFVPTRFD